MKNDKIVSIRIPEKLYNDSKYFASQYNLSFSALVRLLLLKQLKNDNVEFINVEFIKFKK